MVSDWAEEELLYPTLDVLGDAICNSALDGRKIATALVEAGVLERLLLMSQQGVGPSGTDVRPCIPHLMFVAELILGVVMTVAVLPPNSVA